MAEYPPYMNGHSYITKVLEAAKPAMVPPKFTQDFLASKLGVKSTSARAVIPYLKRIGFLSEAGIPTDRYKRFRNNAESGKAIAEGLKEGYSKLYEINEYAHDLSESEIEGLVLQASNAEKGQTSSAVVKSFMALKSLADFSPANPETPEYLLVPELTGTGVLNMLPSGQVGKQHPSMKKLNLSYTINLNLPETTNSEVFDAIFQSLNRNILKENE